ncbi:MAG: hydroxymethylbilane synthase [Kineosporiaceae bacterium]
MTAGADTAGPRSTAVLRVGTRASALARAQSGAVADALARALGRPAELVDVRTHGDVSRAPLSVIGGVGVFVSALRTALLAGEVDIAVHSLKDLPTAPEPGVRLAAVPLREDPRDVLVAARGRRLADLPAEARVGTGSPRRAALLAGRGLTVVDIRGNVDSRLARVGCDLDAVVLAAAGLRRLGRIDAATEILDPEVFLPAPGQGALAVETRDGDPVGDAVAEALDDLPTRLAVTAERALLAALETGCSAPVGALAGVAPTGEAGWRLHLRAVAGHRATGAGRPGTGTTSTADWGGVSRVAGYAEVTDPAGAASAGGRLGVELKDRALRPPPVASPDVEAGAP